MDDIGRLSIAQEILRKMFLRRTIAPVDGMGGVTVSYVCPHCNCFPLDDFIWWISTGHGDGNNRKKKHCNWWCATGGGQYEWRPTPLKRRCSKCTLCRWAVINALKLLANLQKDGDCPIQSIVIHLHERSRSGIMDGLRRSFIEADNHSAVDVGDLRRGTRSVNVQNPQFSEAFPEATIREGADELTLRVDEGHTEGLHQQRAL